MLAMLIGLMKVTAQLGKGGGGFSRFKESISSIQRQQQATILNRPTSSKSEETIVKSQIFQRPATVVEDIRQDFEDTQSVSDSGPFVYGQVEGQPGVDFPGFTSIPNTKFSCDGLPFDGMYADEATGCQVYHLCYQGRRESFLCGVGTVFNQAIMNCDFWHSVDCPKSSQYYHLNADFGKGSAEPSTLQKQAVNQAISSASFSQQVLPIKTEGKTSFVREQKLTSNKVAAQPTINNFNSRVQSSSTFRSVQPQFSGKTSSRESTFRTSDLLSPGQRLQLSADRGLADQTSGQFALESSNHMKVASKTKTTDLRQTSGSTQLRAPALGKVSPSKPSAILNQKPTTTNELVKPQLDGSPWKPYFKKKQSTTSEPPQSTSNVNDMPATVVQPDKEPSFSNVSSAGDDTASSEQPQVPKSGPPALQRDPTVAETTVGLTEPSEVTATKVNEPTSLPATETSIESPVTTAFTDSSSTEQPVTTTSSPTSETTSAPEQTQPAQSEITTTPSPETTEAPQPVARSVRESFVEYAKST